MFKSTTNTQKNRPLNLEHDRHYTEMIYRSVCMSAPTRRNLKLMIVTDLKLVLGFLSIKFDADGKTTYSFSSLWALEKY